MDSRSLILAAFMSTLFLSLPDSINGVSVRILINNACLRSSDSKTCVATLSQNPAISSVSDAISLAQLAIRTVSDQSATAIVFIGRIGPKHPGSFKPLTLCANLFQNTKAILIVDDGDFKTGVATTHVQKALDVVGGCETALKNDKVVIPALDDVIAKWKTLFEAARCATLAAEFDILI